MPKNLNAEINNYESLYKLLSNNDEYSAKLAELKAVEESNRKYVEAIGDVSQIKNIRVETDRLNEEAKEKLKLAEVRSESILLDASNKAQSIIGEANDSKSSIMLELSNRDNELNQRSAEIEKGRSELSESYKKFHKEKDDLRKEIESFERLKDKQYKDFVASRLRYEEARSKILMKFDNFVASIRDVQVNEGD